MENKKIISEISRIKELISLTNNVALISEAAPGPWGKLVNSLLKKDGNLIAQEMTTTGLKNAGDEIAALTGVVARNQNESTLAYIRRAAREASTENAEEIIKILRKYNFNIDDAASRKFANSLSNDQSALTDMAKAFDNDAKVREFLQNQGNLQDATLIDNIVTQVNTIRKGLPTTIQSLELQGIRKGIMSLFDKAEVKIPEGMSNDLVSGLESLAIGADPIFNKTIKQIGSAQEIEKFMNKLVDDISKDPNIKSASDLVEKVNKEIETLVKKIVDSTEVKTETKNKLLSFLKWFVPKYSPKGAKSSDKIKAAIRMNSAIGCYIAALDLYSKFSGKEAAKEICQQDKMKNYLTKNNLDVNMSWNKFIENYKAASDKIANDCANDWRMWTSIQTLWDAAAGPVGRTLQLIFMDSDVDVPEISQTTAEKSKYENDVKSNNQKMLNQSDFEEYIKKDWGTAYNDKVKFSKETGKDKDNKTYDIFVVTDENNEAFKYKINGNTFEFIP